MKITSQDENLIFRPYTIMIAVESSKDEEVLKVLCDGYQYENQRIRLKDDVFQFKDNLKRTIRSV